METFSNNETARTDGPRSEVQEPPAIPSGVLSTYDKRPSVELGGLPTVELVSELIRRFELGDPMPDQELSFLGHRLNRVLGSFIDVHLNRNSRTRLRDIYGSFTQIDMPFRPPIIGKTWVEFGCGSLNPYAYSALMLALGASKAIAIDLDPIGDVAEASRSVSDVFSWLLTDAAAIIREDATTISSTEILANLHGFDLAALAAGSPAGIPVDRLEYRQESIYRLGIKPESVDVVVSNTVLEHLPDVDRALGALARITRPGGFCIHNIDTIDHRFYGSTEITPLEFLSIETDEAIVHGSNRWRPADFIPAFEQSGFDIVKVSFHTPVSVTEAYRSTFVEPWCSTPIENLEPTGVTITARRR